MFELNIREAHYILGEATTGCCPIALALLEKFLGTRPDDDYVNVLYPLRLNRPDVISVKTDRTHFWHPLKDKAYTFYHTEEIESFIVNFDECYEKNNHRELLETSLTFPRPTSVDKCNKSLVYGEIIL